MSLATRCTACGTIFRVVQDQLRVSEGWVRCGRCAEVFDAREQLFDIDRESPPPWPGDQRVADMAPPAPEPPPPEPVLPPALQARPEASFIESDPLPPPMPAPEPEPMYAEPPEEPRVTATPMAAADSRLEPRWVEDDEPAAAAAAAAPSPVAAEDAPEPDVVLSPRLAASTSAKEEPAAPPPPPLPEFMRRAQNGERWRKPGVRIALGAALLVLIGALGLQLSLQFHDAIVALYPPARPALSALCEASGCEIKPWRRIDAVSVEASALNQAGPNNQYQLTVNLRNKSGVEVATPWVELSLSDAAGVVVARRMLAPADFVGSGKPAISAGAELPLQVLLATGNQRVAGYTVEIFHP